MTDIQKPAFIMYGFDTCPHCAELKEYLTKQGLPFKFRSCSDPEVRRRLYEAWTRKFDMMPPMKAMPQLFMDGMPLGDKTAVKAMPIEWLKDLVR